MTNSARTVFRADGNSRIGLGHLIRSLALAEMLKEEFELVFVLQETEEALLQQIKQVCRQVTVLPQAHIDMEEAHSLVQEVLRPTDVVVLDGYSFDACYQQVLKDHGCSLVSVDDIHAYAFLSDAVINPAGGVPASAYATAPYTKLLLGPAYALLRPPFLLASKEKRGLPRGEQRVLLNLGGADPQNHTLQVAKRLKELPGSRQLHIVVGSAYRHLPLIEEWLQEKQGVTLHRNLSAKEMCDLMRSCPTAVTSASGVAYEYASVGGILYVLQTADNQAGLYQFLLSSQIARRYEEIAALSGKDMERAFWQQASVQREYFDGQSDERLLKAFRRLSLGANLLLRPVTEQDMQLLFDWANDPQVRLNSFSPEPILFQDHARWFRAKLEDPQSMLYIAAVAGTPAAHIRFDVQERKATISYLIDGQFRGKGLGHTVLLKGVARLLADKPRVRLVEGLVRGENLASVRAFEKAGFSYSAPDPQYPNVHRFILRVSRYLEEEDHYDQ